MKRSLSPRIASAAVLVGATLLMSGVVATQPARAGGIPALQIRDAGGVRIIAEGGGPTTADLRPGVVNASGSFIASTARDATSKRQRTKVTKGPGSRSAGLAMAYKLIEAAQSRWRKVNAPELVALIRAGAIFKEGVLIENEDTNQEAAA